MTDKNQLFPTRRSESLQSRIISLKHSAQFFIFLRPSLRSGAWVPRYVYISHLNYAKIMEKEKLTPLYIEEKLKSKYLYYRNSLKLGTTNAMEATKNWAVQEYKYVWGVSKPSNEWLEELDKAIRDIAKEV